MRRENDEYWQYDLIIEAEKKARGEQGQQAAVKHLGDQDHVGPVNWKETYSFKNQKKWGSLYKGKCKKFIMVL